MVDRKLVVGGQDGRVRGEDALDANGLHVLLVERGAFELARPFVEQLQAEQL